MLAMISLNSLQLVEVLIMEITGDVITWTSMFVDKATPSQLV